MFDVLSYLLEQYQGPENFGDRGMLMRQLSAVGFEDEEINDALDWLDNVAGMNGAAYAGADTARAMRIYADSEVAHLSLEVRGFLQFLEDHGALSPAQREMVIDRLMEMDADEVEVDRVKLVVLMILWTQQAELPILLGEALLEAVHGEPTMQ